MLQTMFGLTQHFHIRVLMQLIQRHVLADCKPYCCNAQGDEQYIEVMSPTAVFCTEFCLL